MMRRVIPLLAAALVASVAPAGARVVDGRTATAPPGSLELVGHNPLMSRGMNAALAVHGDYAYVGSRTDGKPAGDNLTRAGVFVVDIKDPANPTVVHEIGPPDQGVEGETSREMRVWPRQELLVVMNLRSNCSQQIHLCSPRTTRPDNFRFYDISGTNAAAPKFVAEYRPSLNPHEFHLWQDPHDPDRAIMFISAAGSRRVIVTDISGAREGQFRELLTWGNTGVSAQLHSMTVSNDGNRMFVAHHAGGFVIADTSDIVAGVENPQIRRVTDPARRPQWGGNGAHSTIKLFGRDYVLATEEMYGAFTNTRYDCRGDGPT